MAGADTATLPANGRLALANALANARLEGQDIPSTGNSSPAPTPPARSTAATFDERCGVFTARRYANPGCRRLRPLTDTYTGPPRGCLPNRLGITDPAVLVPVGPERAYGSEVRLCRERPDLRRFDLGHLPGVHR